MDILHRIAGWFSGAGRKETGWRECKHSGKCAEPCFHKKPHMMNTGCINACFHTGETCVMCSIPDSKDVR